MKSKKPIIDYPSPPAQSEEEETVKEQDEESASEHEEESGEEERSDGEEFKGRENIYESRTPNAKPQSQVNKMLNAQKQIVTLPQSSSDSGEEKEDEDEEGGDDELEISQHSLSASGFPIKFITPTKPMPKDSKSTSKRPLEDQRDYEEHLRTEKKAKGKADELKKDAPSAISAAIGEGAGKKWSDDDVKRLLLSIIKFKTKKGLDPATNMTAFCKYVEGKLQREFSRIQIYEKIRRLKIKIFNSVRKFEKGGEESVFFEANELTVCKLSEKIWGGGNDEGMITTRANKTIKWSGKIGSGKEDKKQERKKKNVAEPLYRDDNESGFQSKYPFLTQSFDVGSGGRSFLKENMSLIGHGKAKELDGKWKKMRKGEAELLLKRLELMEEHCSLVLKGMKK